MENIFTMSNVDKEKQKRQKTANGKVQFGEEVCDKLP